MSRKCILTFTVGIALTLSSCASVSPAPPIQITGERQISDKNYVLGQSATAAIGTPLIRVQNFSLANVALAQVEVISDFKIDHFVYTHEFKKGEIYPYAGTVEYQGKTYSIMREGFRGILFDDDGAVFKKIVGGIGDTRLSPVFMVYEFEPTPPGPHLRRLVGEGRKANPDSINYEIVFAGITSDAIHLTYREYAPNDLTHPSITQDLIYPIKSDQIHFKSLVIAVNAVTADHIDYTVVSDGSPRATKPPSPGI